MGNLELPVIGNLELSFIGNLELSIFGILQLFESQFSKVSLFCVSVFVCMFGDPCLCSFLLLYVCMCLPASCVENVCWNRVLKHVVLELFNLCNACLYSMVVLAFNFLWLAVWGEDKPHVPLSLYPPPAHPPP